MAIIIIFNDIEQDCHLVEQVAGCHKVMEDPVWVQWF